MSDSEHPEAWRVLLERVRVPLERIGSSEPFTGAQYRRLGIEARDLLRDALAAQPSAEPGLDVREALDAAEAMADGILRWQRGSVLEHRATRFRRLAAALNPDRPTPGEAT